MVLFPFFGIPLGLNFIIWGSIGLLRWMSETFGWQKTYPVGASGLKISDIAVLLPAHNEELVIGPALRKLKHSLSVSQIYVASDGSSDRTTEFAKKEGVHVVSLNPGLGKAKALRYLIDHFRLFSRYKLILILDADTQLERSFFSRALRFFDDPEIVTVFAAINIHWPKHVLPIDRLHIISYRERLHWLLYHLFSYGQTWKYTNVLHVVPGFSALYRSETLAQIDFDAPGLLIEDFNTAFQIHKKKLGKIGFSPDLVGVNQHPDSVGDYWKQVKRWNIGFFQTVKKNGLWPSWFWVVLAGFLIEVGICSLFLLFLPSTILFQLVQQGYLSVSWWYHILEPIFFLNPFKYVSLWDVFIPFFFADYILTIVAAHYTKKPQMMFYGLFFIFFHIMTAAILVVACIPGFFSASSGRWVSPKRQAMSG